MNNNYQQQIVNYLNQYLADEAVLSNKISNYHWNLVGNDFFSVHAKFQEYYEKANEMVDLIAERIKQLGGYPLTSLKTYSEIATIKSAESKNYTSKEAITSLIADFSYMLNAGIEISRFAETAGDIGTSSLISDYLNYLEKQLWMLGATLK